MPTAYVLVKCEEGAERGLVRKLGGKGVIMEVQPTVGHYDLIAKITSPNTEHLDMAIEEIHTDYRVRSTKVLILNEPVEAA